MHLSEVYLEPCQTIKIFAIKIRAFCEYIRARVTFLIKL